MGYKNLGQIFFLFSSIAVTAISYANVPPEAIMFQSGTVEDPAVQGTIPPPAGSQNYNDLLVVPGGTAYYDAESGKHVLTLDGSRSFDPDHTVEDDELVFHWYFGDGSYVSGEAQSVVTHEYTHPGMFNVFFWVSDGNVKSKVISKTIQAINAPQPSSPASNDFQPFTASFPLVGEVNEKLSFSATGGFDIQNDDHDILIGWKFGDGCEYNTGFFWTGDWYFDSTPPPERRYVWDGDGTATQISQGSKTGAYITYSVRITDGSVCESSGFNTTHTYRSAGNYRADLYAFETWVESGLHQEYVHLRSKTVVVNTRPKAVVDAPKTGLTNQNIVFHGSKSSDADGHSVTYLWDFGDGTTSKLANPSHTYTEPGEYDVSLIVHDSYHASVPTTTKVNVTKGAWLIPILNLIISS